MLVHLEEPGPLSQSVIWQIERDVYAAQGVDGWRAGTVPHYITSNPFIAGSFASVVLGFLRDCAVRDDIDRSRPIDIVELGEGPGRFGFHFVRQLVELADQARTELVLLASGDVISPGQTGNRRS